MVVALMVKVVISVDNNLWICTKRFQYRSSMGKG